MCVRAGLVIYGSLDTLSGGYLYDRYLVEHLRGCGDQVEIMSLPPESYVRCLGHNFSSQVYARLADPGLDLLLQDELNHPSLAYMNRRLRRRTSVPIVSIVHHLRSDEPHFVGFRLLYRLVEQKYLGTVDGFVFNSGKTQRATESLLGQRCPAIVAQPAGNRLRPALTDHQIAARSFNDGPIRLLFLGNVIQRKGLHILIQALRKLPAESWELTVVGSLEAEARYARKIQERVAALGWDRRLRFTGPLQEAELAAELKQHHLLTLPSYHEGFGIAYLEAMGFGLPAIGSSSGGASEVISDGKNGYLIEPGDVNLLAERLRSLQRDRRKLVQLSLAARQRYAAHPTWEMSMKRIRVFLLDVIEYTGRAQPGRGLGTPASRPNRPAPRRNIE